MIINKNQKKRSKEKDDYASDVGIEIISRWLIGGRKIAILVMWAIGRKKTLWPKESTF